MKTGYHVPDYVEQAMCRVTRNSKHTWDYYIDTEDGEPIKGVKCGACGREAVEILEDLIRAAGWS